MDFHKLEELRDKHAVELIDVLSEKEQRVLKLIYEFTAKDKFYIEPFFRKDVPYSEAGIVYPEWKDSCMMDDFVDIGILRRGDWEGQFILSLRFKNAVEKKYDYV